MAKKRISADDSDLFRQAAGEVTPVVNERAEHDTQRPSANRKNELEANVREPRADSMSDDAMGTLPDDDGPIEFYRTGLQQRLVRKFRRGQMPVQAELDLHGMTVAQARDALAIFLEESQAHRCRVVRVIHGKGFGSKDGRGVLRHFVGRWLRLRDDVMACCPARRDDGGSGAVYLLLKRG